MGWETKIIFASLCLNLGLLIGSYAVPTYHLPVNVTTPDPTRIMNVSAPNPILGFVQLIYETLMFLWSFTYWLIDGFPYVVSLLMPSNPATTVIVYSIRAIVLFSYGWFLIKFIRGYTE